MSNIKITEVDKVIRLSRIKLTPEEKSSLAGDLDRILAFAQQLQSVDTEGVAPFLSPSSFASSNSLNNSLNNSLGAPTGIQGMVMRDDIVTDGNYPAEITSNAPESEFNMFVVPKVVE